MKHVLQLHACVWPYMHPLHTQTHFKCLSLSVVFLFYSLQHFSDESCLGKGTRTLRTGLTPRKKPPCFGADLLECNQRVRSVIFRVIIFRSPIQAVGQITQQPTGRPQPSHYTPSFRLDVYSLSFHLILQRTYYN